GRRSPSLRQSGCRILHATTGRPDRKRWSKALRAPVPEHAREILPPLRSQDPRQSAAKLPFVHPGSRSETGSSAIVSRQFARDRSGTRPTASRGSYESRNLQDRKRTVRAEPHWPTTGHESEAV